MTSFTASFLLLAYNQERTVAAAVQAALDQAGPPLDIVLSDDASTDETFAVMQQLAEGYSGPHRVRIRQSPRNRGIVGHVHDVVAEAEGELLVFAAGDDVSLPERSRTIVQAWVDHGRGTASLYSDYYPVDQGGAPVDIGQDYLFTGRHTLQGMARGFIEAFGGSAAYTRDLFLRFPPIMPDVIHEDRVLPFRALLLGGQVIVIPEKLVRYTVAGGVSRQEGPTGMKDFALRFFPRQQQRLLGDARQRERDIAQLHPASARITQLCRMTVETHEAVIRLSAVKGLTLEFRLMKSLLRGAHFVSTTKHYLKIRLPLRYKGQR